MTDAIYSEIYNGHKIEIMPDMDAQSPKEWGNDSFLVHFHRDCWIENDVISENNLREWYNGEKISQSTNYFIFAVSAYIHSGVVLSLENTFPSDGYGWDTSHVGAVLVDKKEAKTKKQAYKIAKSVVDEWNEYLSGDVYGFVVDEGEGDSCGGFYGDYKYAIEEAKNSIDCMVKENVKKHGEKLKAYIKNNVPLEKREALKM